MHADLQICEESSSNFLHPYASFACEHWLPIPKVNNEVGMAMSCCSALYIRMKYEVECIAT